MISTVAPDVTKKGVLKIMKARWAANNSSKLDFALLCWGEFNIAICSRIAENEPSAIVIPQLMSLATSSLALQLQGFVYTQPEVYNCVQQEGFKPRGNTRRKYRAIELTPDNRSLCKESRVTYKSPHALVPLLYLPKKRQSV